MANLGSAAMQVREDRAIYRAIKILETRFKDDNANVISSPNAVKDYLRLLLSSEEREVFTVILLDAKNRVIDAKGLFYGTLSETSIYPREVVIYALKHNAAAVILAHNHPTGNAKPSKADMLMTEQLKEVLALVDVKVLDHIIVAERVTLSFLEMGLL